VEPFPQGRDTVDTEAIRFRFWPPVPTDDAERWTCPCDEPTNDESGPGHWAWVVPVKPPPPPPRVVGAVVGR
jgi:hypothetical protein